MTKLQLLHRALNERLMAAVEQIMEMVGGTVLEYEEETIRARKENEVLRRRLRWMQGANPADWPGPSEPITISTPDESNPNQQDEVNFGQESEGLVIKTETTDHPLYSATTLPQRIDQGSDIAGTSTGITYGLADGTTWDSAQSYMAPLDFDPTSGSTRVRHWRGQNRRQRMSFACPDCGKVFGREQRLLIHMRIHSTERPYKYRRRKAFFYGDNKKKRKLHGLSQLSREIVDDLSDCSEQTSRSSASPERLAPNQEEEPGSQSTESDHTSSDKEPKNRTTASVRDRHKKKTGAMHMKTHTVKALVNLPKQAQSGADEIMDVKMKPPPKKQRKIDAVKKDKDAGKRKFHCPKCDKVFALETRLRFHMKSHKTEKALSRKNLKMPIQTQPSKEESMEAVPKTTEVQNLQELKKTFACPHCDKVFIREGWLEPHIRSQHRKVKKRHIPCEIMLDSSRGRSQPYYQRLRERTAEKQAVTEESKIKNEESKKVNAKPSPSIDESNLVVAGYTQQLRKRTAEKQGVTKELKQNNEESKKVNAKPSPSIDESNLVVACYTQHLRKRTAEKQAVTEESKIKNEESKKVNAKPSPSSDESNLVVDVPKIATEQNPDLPKRRTDESMCTPEQTKDTSVSNRKTAVTKTLKRFPCKVCGKAFVGEKKFRKHSRKHMRRRLPREKKRKSEEALGETELTEQAGMRLEEDKERLDKTSTSNHNPNTQTPQGTPNKELQKGKTRGQGPLPCPFCGKVFAWEMRLLMHMQIHCGEKPYSYRQREKRFYGDLKRGQLPKIHNQEPPGNNSDKSEESAGEETVNEDGSAHLSSSTTHAVSGALTSSTETTGMEDCTGSLGLLPQIVIKQPTTCNKSNQIVKPEQFRDVMSHFSLQPRIVLEPIMTECKYWSSVSGDLKSGRSERSSFDHEEPSCSVLVDDDDDEEIVDAVECSGHGSPQRDSQSEMELDNFEGPLAVKSTEGNNTESQQKEDHDCYFPGVSEKTAMNQLPLIIIDDELEQSNTRTEHAPSECGRMKCDSKCDCTNISAMKLTVMPQTSDLRSLFKETKIDSELVCVISDVEDDVDEDVLMCSSKELDEKKTASVPSIENEQFDASSKSGKNPSSDSSFPAPEATESINTESICVHAKSIDGTFKHTGAQVVTSERKDQSILNDPLTRDQIDSIAIRQTEDNPMNSMKERPFQTSENPSGDSNFPAPDATESIKTDESTCVHAKSVDGTFKHTGVQVVTSEINDQSILNDPLTRDQIDSIAIRQTEDNPMNLMEERPFQTSENPSSDSNFPAPDVTESIKTDESTCVHGKSIHGTSKHTDVPVVASERNDQSISNDPLTSDKMASVAITQTESNRMNSVEELSCQTSDMVFAGQASLSEVSSDKNLVDMEIVSGDERKNKLCEQPEFVLEDSADNSEISGKNEPYVKKDPECQSNSTDDLFKIHHCCYCKQPHYRMMDHLQSVHPNEPEVAKALSFDQSSQERKQLLNLLQTKGNVLHRTNVVQSSKQDLKPFSMFASDCSFDDSVYCIYCLGLFNKKSFATHLEQCKRKSIDSVEDSCDEILPNAGPVPPTPTLSSPWNPEEIDANLEPAGFHCLNTTYETEQLNLYNEQGSSSHQDVTCSIVQLDVEAVRNDGQTEGANLQFKYSENEVGYDFKSVNSRNPKTGQESTDCKNEEISHPICEIDQERTMTATSDICAIKAHQEYVVLRNPYDDFSPPHSNPTVSNDSVKAQTYGTGRRRKRKRRSHVQNKSLIMDYGLLGEGEGPNSKIHVCQHCRATFCSSYTLRRHEYTHTGERPFWCHHCNMGFIQKYRLLKHTFAYHGDVSTNTDLEKLKRPKRGIQGGETSMNDEVSLEPSAKSPKDLPDAVNDETEEKVAATMQDTEARGFHWEEAGHSKIKDTDC